MTHGSEERIWFVADNYLPGGLDLLSSGWKADGTVCGYVLGSRIMEAISKFFAKEIFGATDVS